MRNRNDSMGDDTDMVPLREKVRHTQISLPISWWQRLEALKPRMKAIGFEPGPSLTKAVMKWIERMEEKVAPNDSEVISLNGRSNHESTQD